MSDKYAYRPDGMYYCRCTCQHCGEQFDLLAIANHRDYCQACEQVLKWERELLREGQ